MVFKFLVMASILSFHSLHPFIIESNHIENTLQYVDNDTLVIFDIDNTIGKPDNELGSDQCFYYLRNKIISCGKTKDEAIEELLPLYLKIHEHTHLIPIEPCTISLIQTLQNNGLKVIALTSRSSILLGRTIEQINQMGIDFQQSSLTEHEFDFTFNKHDKHKKVTHKEGIIFCGKNNKGDILMHTFIHLNYYPKKVIFIDDKKQYLLCVQRAMERMGIPFVGIRYGACDEHIKNFDLEQAERELKKFDNNLEALIMNYQFLAKPLATLPKNIPL